MTDGAPELLDSLLDRQSRSWLAGSRPRVEDILGGSSLRNDPDAQLDLIYNEILLRERIGERPDHADYLARYPHLSDALGPMLEVHSAMDADAGLTNTARIAAAATAPGVNAALPRHADYAILETLGRGGMGVVYKARDARLRRLVALKTFEPGRLPWPREIARFRTEAEAVARLQHPNVVQIFEIGERDGLPFLALELATGGTLADRLRQFSFTPRAAAELLETLARAVQHAHAAGIVHRDLKPANVLFAADGTPKLTDFGLAKVLEDDVARDATRTGEPVGTPRYMSPEQAAGQNDRVGPATDVYALGTLLYECLTGQVPFVAPGVADTLHRIRFEEPVSPRRLQPAVPRDLATICLHCLHKEPQRRYPTASELADDLRRFLDGRAVRARPVPAWERAVKWCRRKPAHAALVAVGVLLLVAAATGAGIAQRIRQQRVETARDRVEALMAAGQEALARDDDATAEARFREAWETVQGEPALRDYGTGVAGWLDHARRAGLRYRWAERAPPPEYPERRDAALFRSALFAPDGDDLPAARESISAAFHLTLPNDPAWRAERERLAVLEADLLLAARDPAAALARLDSHVPASSRLFHARRAACLDALNRPAEAAECRAAGERLPPDGPAARLYAGLAAARGRDYDAAARAFEAVLDAEPEHFAARLLLAACALEQGRPGEAKVGLTACVAQRPYCATAYRLRARCADLLGDAPAARRDRDRAAALTANRPGG
jgi:tRNA A-37 threonylcarbamoyl transferase component Bud32/tetratricopeptide (TPR) repeat protein